MIKKFNCIKSNIFRSRLKLVRTQRQLPQTNINNGKYFDHYYVDAPYSNVIIDDLIDLDLSNPWAIKRVKYRGKYLR